jgi:TonB family protein
VTDLSFTITTHGVPVDVNIDKSSGNTSLDAAAVACAQSWRYTESKFNSPGFREPWGVQIIWKGGHVFVVQVPK